MDRETLKRILLENSLAPNRALGQNFLVDETIVRAILDGAGIDGLPVLEVGPGLGALTEGLLIRAARVVAVEKDAALAEILIKRLPDTRLTVEAADFLQFDVRRAMGNGPFAAVGNLPYYITTPIAERLVCLPVCSVTLMVQSEAAERFFARPGDRVYGPLAGVAQAFYRVEALLDVPPGAFYPAPEVNSRVVRLMRRERADGAEPEAALRFMKRAFAMRRKTLLNALGRRPGLAGTLSELGLPADVRAEAVDPETLMQLFTNMKEEAET